MELGTIVGLKGIKGVTNCAQLQVKLATAGSEKVVKHQLNERSCLFIQLAPKKFLFLNVPVGEDGAVEWSKNKLRLRIGTQASAEKKAHDKINELLQLQESDKQRAPLRLYRLRTVDEMGLQALSQ